MRGTESIYFLFSQLTVELYNKLEKSGEESEDSQIATKNITPFPYRIAKALDPNIYRNTDFDIWHEIKRGMDFIVVKM